jgi:carnitine O-acetyltransferase
VSGTFDSDATLPRVPVPSLSESCTRLVDWCAPLLNEEELERTGEAVAALAADPVAARLQDTLVAYEASTGVHSWLDEFWRDRYLGRRDRIALNANFFFLFGDGLPHGAPRDQVGRAARLIEAAVRYKLAIDDQAVPPATRRGQPLSMEQHHYLFSTTRIPGVQRDGVRAPYTESWPGPSDARHILVIARGGMWAVDVVTAGDLPYETGEIAGALRSVLSMAGQGRAWRGQGTGALTSKARAEWASSRDALLAAGNQAVLDIVETALFCVVLEDEPAAGLDDHCKRLLAGDPGNRWFDKALTLIVFPDGTAGLNGEHCLLDGTTTVEFIDAVLTAPEPAPGSGATDSGVTDSAVTAPARIRPVEFVLTDALKADIDAAAKDYLRYGEDTATRPVSYPGFGSSRAKSLRISPDALVQLAFQLAHYRSKGFIGATYESIATRQFHHGRTEAMRVVTPEIVSFTHVMDDPGADAATRLAALRRAADAHVARARDCQAGDAPEQHLWELQLLGRRQGVSWSPALYSSPGWTRMRDDYLSTSSCPSANVQYFGFGATSTHCIGVAYVLLPERFNVYLSTPAAVEKAMAGFASGLGAALSEMAALLEAAPRPTEA